MADNRLKAVATAQAYDQGNIASLDDAMTRRLIASTVLTESYGGDLDPVNRLGYVGRYQAGAAWLVDAGYMDLDRYNQARSSMSERDWERGGGQLRFMQDARNWENGLSFEQYMASDDLQDRAFKNNCDRSYRQAVRNGLLDEDASQEQVAGFLKARHLSGYNGARNVVQGGRVIRDENGTSNYDYYHDITRDRDRLDALMTQSPQTVSQQQTQSRPGNFNDVMRVMLPPQNGIDPHLTSDYGPRSVSNGSSNHKGVDFNYEGGQTGINLRHPTVRSPVSGTVEMPANSAWNTVGIRDSQGNLHQVLHLDSRSVRNGQPIDAGDPIGTMGNTNDRDPNMAQHVHYQIRDTSGQLVNPETFWNGRTVEGQSRDGGSQAAVSSAMADGVLRQRDRGPEVTALQETLNRLGYTGRDGQPLETRSGVYGLNTHHAVEEFQRRHGLADVDGIVGSRTRDALTNAATRPLLSEATHPNHRLYAQIARQLPAGTTPEVAANVTLQAMENGVTSVDKLSRVDVRGSDVFVMGGTPGDRVRVDLQAPTPGMQQMSDYTREQAERPPQQTQQQTQQQPSQLQDPQERNQRVMTA